MPIDENCKYITLLDFGFHDMIAEHGRVRMWQSFYLHMEKNDQRNGQMRVRGKEEKVELFWNLLWIPVNLLPFKSDFLFRNRLSATPFLDTDLGGRTWSDIFLLLSVFLDIAEDINEGQKRKK